MRMQYKRTLITPLGADGKIQAAPVLAQVPLTNNTVEPKQESKKIELIGNCCGQKVIFGTKDVSGSLGGIMTTAVASIITQHIMGAFDTVVDATTDVWATATVVAEGDKVNHTDGTHSLVCTKSGTTGATEPVITSSLKTVDDGTAKWLIVDKLKKGTVNTAKKPRAIAIENEFVKDDGTSVYMRYTGVYLTKNNVSAKGGDIEVTWSSDVVGASVEDSLDEGFVALKDMPGAVNVKMNDDLFTNNEDNAGFIVNKDGVPLCGYEELSFDVTRKVEKGNGMPCYENGKFVAPLPVVSADVMAENGKLVAYATTELYESFKAHEEFNVDIEAVNGMGGSIKYYFNGVLPNSATITLEDCIDSKISPELFVTGACDPTNPPVWAEVVFPQNVDTAGNAIVYPV